VTLDEDLGKDLGAIVADSSTALDSARQEIVPRTLGPRPPCRSRITPYDFVALEDIRREGQQDGFLPERKGKGFHMADQLALPVADVGQGVSQMVLFPME